MAVETWPPKPPKTPIGVYQYPRPQRPRLEKPSPLQRVEPPDVTAEYFVHGLSARRPEFFTWKALVRAGFIEEDLRFQVGFNGGRSFKGGFVIDIIVPTRPLPTPVFVNGEFWHDPTKAAILFGQIQKLNELFPGQFAEAVIIWAGEVDNEELAFMTVLTKIGRP